MPDPVYDIAPADQSVLSEEDLADSAKATADLENEFPVAEPVHGGTPSPTPGWTEAARFQPVPRPDPFPFLDEESVPTEEDRRDALVKLVPNSGLREEEASKYAETLRKYYEAEDAEALSQKKDNVKAQYRTPDGLLQVTKNPVVRQEMDMSPDDDLVAKRALNRNFLATMYDKPNASPEELDALMREHSIKHWGINNPSQETFYTKTREDIAKEDEQTKVWRTVAKTTAQDILKEEGSPGTPRSSTSERFEKLAKAHPKEITAQNRDQWYQTMVLMEDRIRHLSKDARFPASQIIDLAEKMTTGEPTELDWDRAVNSLRNINPNDLSQALKIASIAVREEDPKGEMISTIMQNLGKRFDRDFTLTKIYEQDRELLLNDQINNLKAGMVIGKDANGRLAFAHPGQPLPPSTVQLSPDEYKAYWNDAHRAMDGMQIARVLKQFQEQVRDPVTPYFKGGLLGMAEGGVYDVAGFSKLIPLGLIPGPAGLMSMAKVVSASTYHDLRLENPNLPIETARDLANLDGVVNSIGMKFKTDFLLGRYPFFKSARTLKGAGQTLEALKLYGRWAGIHQVEENLEELAQDTTSAAIHKLYADANPSTMKQQTWDDLLTDIAKSRMQVAFAVAPLSLIGAGAATIRDLRNPMRDFMNPDALKSVGLSDEKVAEVLAAGNLEEAEKVFQKHYNALTPENIKAGFDYAAGLGEQQEVDAAMADPVLPSLEPAVMPDGTYKYNVIDADGKILSSHIDPDVAEMAWIRETERVQDEHKAAMQDEANQQAAAQAEAEAAAAASDEGIEKEAEAKVTVEMASPEDRLGTALTVDFEENVAPTPQEAANIAQLQADVRSSGRTDVIVHARPSDIQTGPGKATLNFVRAFERATGKQVVFVASGNDQPLSFTGAVRAGDPNTIFLDAHGDRNVLALVGHEWSHTLEHTSPQLHAEMIGRMKPSIVDWAKQEGILSQELGVENVTNEMVANIVGDAISNEGFWVSLAQKNPGLFEKVRDAVLKFFNQFINRVRTSEFGTEAFADATKMRDIVADIMDRAGRGEQTVARPTAVAGGEGVSFAARRQVEKGFYRRVDEVVADKLPKSTSPEQAKATINGAGLKAEEIKWTGVMQAIDRIAAENNGRIPKEKLEEHLQNEGDAKFKEVEFGVGAKVPDEFNQRYEEIVRLRDYGGQISAVEANRRITALRQEFDLDQYNRPSDTTKFASYQLPGGENYREVVLSMPEFGPHYSVREEDGKFMIVAPNGAIMWQQDRDKLTDEQMQSVRERYLQPEPVDKYHSSHFPDVPNYVAHSRMNERTDAEGKPGLFLEEIQSDRHQQGREKGYAGEVMEYVAYYTTAKHGDIPLGYGKTAEEAMTDVSESWKTNPLVVSGEVKIETKAVPSQKEGIPDAPFRKDWPLAMFKRALRDAVATGKEWIGWTTGETQEERYWGHELVQPAVKRWNELAKPDRTGEQLEDHFGSELASMGPLKVVDTSMLLGLKNNKIREAVIQAIPIDVVNMLAKNGFTPNQLFSKNNVVSDALSINDRTAVTRGLASALELVGTKLRTALNRVLSPEATGRNEEVLPAVRASDLDPRIVMRALSSFGRTDLGAKTGALVGKGPGARYGAEPSMPSRRGDLTEVSPKLTTAQLAEALNRHARIISRDTGKSIEELLVQSPPGEGMKGFYDKMLPNEVGKYVKQWGGKVEKGELGKPDRYTVASKGNHWIVWDEQENRTIRHDIENEPIDSGLGYGIFAIKQSAQELANALNEREEQPKIWKIEITSQMSEGVAKGQVQFAPRKEPAIRPGAREVAVTVFDRQAKGFVQKSMPPSRELLRDLQREKNLYEKLLTCLL